MAVTIEGSGTVSAVIGTEHTLLTDSDPKVFVLLVDTLNMALGDTLILRVYVQVLSGGALREAYTAVFTHTQPDEEIKISIPVPSPGHTNGFRATLQQTTGAAGRDFDWSVVSV